MEISRVLLTTNLGIDMGTPDFRVGSIKTYLLPLADRLAKDLPECDIKFLVGNYTFSNLLRDPHFQMRGREDFLTLNTSKVFPDKAFGDRVISQLYNGNLPAEDLGYLNSAILKTLGDFRPDLVVCWESPSQFLRDLFPESQVIDLMPGTFMRPPYPKMVAVDPCGIYKDSGLKYLLSGSVMPTELEIETFREVQAYYSDFYEAISSREKILGSVTSRKFDRYVLLPLQVSGYFGYRENCEYKDQFDLVESTLRSQGPKTGVIVTQYISGLAADRVINSENANHLKQVYRNLIYGSAFDSLNNISQYIAPWADETISVSSTVGLQASFFCRKLSSPSTSHLKYVETAQNDIGMELSACLIGSRYSFQWDRIVDEPHYFVNLANSFADRRSNNPVDFYQNWESPLSVDGYILRSNFRRAAQMFSETFEGLPEVSNARVANFCTSIDAADVVSFDVFDTLLQRSVMNPADVFVLTPFRNAVPGSRVAQRISQSLYSEMRRSVERAQRIQRDKELQLDNSLSEEIFTSDIFRDLASKIASDSELGADAAGQSMLSTEESCELSVLSATRLGRTLFNYAKSKGKRVIIISDFCHSQEFVERALRSSGYDDFELFVSSKYGMKKHSGNLFKLVANSLQIDTSKALHIGDNAHGDKTMAAEAGWRSLQISLPKNQFTTLLKHRNFPVGSMHKSIAVRTHHAMYVNRYLSGDMRPSLIKSIQPIADGHEQFGYLAIGPIVLAFARWILQDAVKRGVSQVAFFARDCILPFRAAKVLVDEMGDCDVRCFYVAASRSSTKGLDFTSPDAVYDVDISDFSRNSTVGEVLLRRFRIPVGEIGPDSWAAASILPDQKFGQVSIAAIYSFAHRYFSSKWSSSEIEVGIRRSRYRTYLESLGIDMNKPVGLVDVGYKGTISRVVGSLFTQKPAYYFMSTYAGELGRDPIDDPICFLGERSGDSPFDSFRRFNLIMETLLNEPVGSAASFYSAGEEGVEVVREAAPSDRHVAAVSKIHAGAMRFVEDWVSVFKNDLIEPRFEPNMAFEMFTALLDRPVAQEAELLNGLEFDNNFAGHAPRYILNTKGEVPEGIWAEGIRALLDDRSHLETRVKLIANGALIDFDYDIPHISKDTFEGTLQFGFGARGVTVIAGVKVNYCWAHSEVCALLLNSADMSVRRIRIEFIDDAHFNRNRFRVWQYGVELPVTVVRVGSRAYGIEVLARPGASIVVRQQSFRGTNRAAGDVIVKDKRKFYWRFLSAFVV